MDCQNSHDNSYGYAIKDGKILYADDDYHSVDGSTIQAQYLIKDIIKDDK